MRADAAAVHDRQVRSAVLVVAVFVVGAVAAVLELAGLVGWFPMVAARCVLMVSCVCGIGVLFDARVLARPREPRLTDGVIASTLGDGWISDRPRYVTAVLGDGSTRTVYFPPRLRRAEQLVLWVGRGQRAWIRAGGWLMVAALVSGVAGIEGALGLRGQAVFVLFGEAAAGAGMLAGLAVPRLVDRSFLRRNPRATPAGRTAQPGREQGWLRKPVPADPAWTGLPGRLGGWTVQASRADGCGEPVRAVWQEAEQVGRLAELAVAWVRLAGVLRPDSSGDRVPDPIAVDWWDAKAAAGHGLLGAALHAARHGTDRQIETAVADLLAAPGGQKAAMLDMLAGMAGRGCRLVGGWTIYRQVRDLLDAANDERADAALRTCAAVHVCSMAARRDTSLTWDWYAYAATRPGLGLENTFAAMIIRLALDLDLDTDPETWRMPAGFGLEDPARSRFLAGFALDYARLHAARGPHREAALASYLDRQDVTHVVSTGELVPMVIAGELARRAAN